jgi:SAM-dependent methyltransferase
LSLDERDRGGFTTRRPIPVHRSMKSIRLDTPATDANFDEAAYLRGNPDVRRAVGNGQFASGRAHWELFGRNERRQLRFPDPGLRAAKHEKMRRIEALLRTDLPFTRCDDHYDFLGDALRAQFNIVDTEAVGAHGYEANISGLIEKYRDGWLLDCGAGRRPAYYANVVNFEIVDYDTTDVRGVGEVLPFVDNAFDAVISKAVLEHVKDPFRCAREIARVLNPGGELFCFVPFLQPLHGYPHHYYNMTHQGLINLFADTLEIDRVEVPRWALPVYSLTWIIQSWANGLPDAARKEFVNLRLADLMQTGDKYLDRSFVTELSAEKNLELASGTLLFAHKPA